MEYASYMAKEQGEHINIGKEHEPPRSQGQDQDQDQQQKKKHISWAEQLVSMEYIAYSKQEYDRSWSQEITVVQGLPCYHSDGDCVMDDDDVHDFEAGIGLDINAISHHTTTTTTNMSTPYMLAPVRRTKPIGGFYFMGVAENHGRRTITHNPQSFLSINQ